MRAVYCPVLERQVNGTECLEVVLVADRMISAETLPSELRWDGVQRQTCLRCYYHADVDYRKRGSVFLTERQEIKLAECNIPVFERTQETLKALKDRISVRSGESREHLQRLYAEILAQNGGGKNR